jgi:hypothetical protein
LVYDANAHKPRGQLQLSRAGPQESEAVKKNLVKLGDAYAILGNLRLSTGHKKFGSAFILVFRIRIE